MIAQKTVVVKFGSESLTDKSGLLSQERINLHAANIIGLQEKLGARVVIVSSGAVAAGKEYLQKVLFKETTDVSSQSLAATGNPILANAWSSAFRPYGLATGLILVTNHEISDKTEGLAIQKTDTSFAADKTIAIYNANDAIEHDEIDKLEYGGDNDWLAAHLAVKLRAHTVLFATNVDGFITTDGTVQKTVVGSKIDELAEHFFKSSDDGRGGIESKLAAANFAALAGVAAYIANANSDYGQVLAGLSGTQVIQ